jgi:hypothetical protein
MCPWASSKQLFPFGRTGRSLEPSVILIGAVERYRHLHAGPQRLTSNGANRPSTILGQARENLILDIEFLYCETADGMAH